VRSEADGTYSGAGSGTVTGAERVADIWVETGGLARVTVFAVALPPKAVN